MAQGVVLTVKMVAGLSTEEIARAFPVQTTGSAHLAAVLTAGEQSRWSGLEGRWSWRVPR
jgi:predicted RNA polymerase sigma factor